MSNARSEDKVILIVGAGVFGLSLAYELASKRGYTNITVLDRYPPPVVDGSSVDINRIIRSDYADPVYEALGREALQGWRGPDYRDFYHETGFAMITAKPSHEYIARVGQVQEKLGSAGRVAILDHQEADAELKSRYPGVEADLKGYMASLNPQGGWADAEQSIRALAARAAQAGVSFITGKSGTVQKLEYQGQRVTGVRVASGVFLPAEQVILATGAWTSRLIGQVDHAILASAQPVGFIQLTADEAERLRSMPVITNMDSGVFCFPPTPVSHIIKVARHGHGYTTEYPTLEGSINRLVSSPKLEGNNTSSQFLPEDAEKDLRQAVRHFFPSIGDRPWLRKRLCWYTNTPTGDFVVDHHIDIDGLFIATGGSGHGFKFLPVLGKHIADCFEGKASDKIRSRWRLKKGSCKVVDMAGDGSRSGPPLRTLESHEQAEL